MDQLYWLICLAVMCLWGGGVVGEETKTIKTMTIGAVLSGEEYGRAFEEAIGKANKEEGTLHGDRHFDHKGKQIMEISKFKVVNVIPFGSAIFILLD